MNLFSLTSVIRKEFLRNNNSGELNELQKQNFRLFQIFMILTFFFFYPSLVLFKTNSAYIFIKTNPFSMYDVIYALSLKCSPTKNFLGEQIPFFLLFFNAFALFENFLFFKNLPFFYPLFWRWAKGINIFILQFS